MDIPMRCRSPTHESQQVMLLFANCFLVTPTIVARVWRLAATVTRPLSLALSLSLCVCFSVCPHDKTETAESKIIKPHPPMNIRSKDKCQGHNSQGQRCRRAIERPAWVMHSTSTSRAHQMFNCGRLLDSCGEINYFLNIKRARTLSNLTIKAEIC